MNKKELRDIIRQRKRQFSSDELRELSLAVCQRLLANPRVTAAKTILLYYSLPDEVCTHSLVDELAAMGKKVLLPAVVSDTDMEARIYRNADDLKMGAFGIAEPAGDKYSDLKAIDLAIVPGMSFDNDGNRLGRGKGYYDRFLSAIPYIYKIGVCFDFQKVDYVPHSPHDVVMDEVL
ncbi:MAG: 5-formyltetrahydrofolate cyclo-ligase [Prevotella sp.]